MGDKKDKNFIFEKVLGREMTFPRTLKYLLVSLLCGIVFGGSAFVVFYFANEHMALNRKAAVDATETALETETFTEPSVEETTVPEETTPEETAAPETMETETETESETETSTEAVTETETEAESETESETEAETETESEEKKINTIEDAIEIINKNLVEVSVSVSETTWFDSTVETKKTYSGIVLEKNEDEILILTMISVADPSDSIKVKFDNGFESEAFIKGKLQRDKLVVLSVPAAEMSVVHLMGFSPCEIAEPEDIKSGVEFIAAGSPLGVEKTYDFGNIGYTIKYESSLDGAVQCFYSKVDASEEFGTFAFDLDGRLLGIALSSDTQKIIGTRFVYTGSLTRLIDDMKNAETSSYIGIKGSNMINPLGVYVEDIDMDSPAYLAGLKKGDIIVGAGEKAISSNDDLNAFMSELRPEETVTLKILRMTAREGFAEMEMEITAAVR